jgi:flagellar basal body P-ring formation protein FlgA
MGRLRGTRRRPFLGLAWRPLAQLLLLARRNKEPLMPASISRHLLVLLALTAATPAAAQHFEDLADVEQRVIAALGASIGEAGGPARPIDRRLRLARCPEPVGVEEPALGAVTVRCASLGWRIRVPLARGEGGEMREARPAGAAVRSTRRELAVRRGDPVVLVVVSGGFTVSRQATADQDGAVGDRIRVRTEPRAPLMVGEVLPDGRVALAGFN